MNDALEPVQRLLKIVILHPLDLHVLYELLQGQVSALPSIDREQLLCVGGGALLEGI